MGGGVVRASVHLSSPPGTTIETDFGAVCPRLVHLGNSRGAVPMRPSS